MAVMPGVIWRPLTTDKSRWRLVPLRVNLHVAVSEAASLFGYFNGARSRPDSHFYVRRDGTIEQYVDTALVAYADLEGNGSTISIETQGGVTATQTEPWTTAQLDAMARIYAWAVKTHGIAVQIATDSRPGKTSHGLSWHRLGCDGNFPGPPLHGRVASGRRYSRARGKVCPGNAKIRQVPDVYRRALPLINDSATGRTWLDMATKNDLRDVVRAELDRHAAQRPNPNDGARQERFRYHDRDSQLLYAATAGLELPIVSGHIAGLTEAVKQLATGQGVDPAQIEAAVARGVEAVIAGVEADVTLNINTTQED